MSRTPLTPATVATVLTVYGIETSTGTSMVSSTNSVATVLTVYGIETPKTSSSLILVLLVATVLTVYGIETSYVGMGCNAVAQLQQYLPFTVLKLTYNEDTKVVNLAVSCNSTYRLRY